MSAGEMAARELSFLLPGPEANIINSHSPVTDHKRVASRRGDLKLL